MTASPKRRMQVLVNLAGASFLAVLWANAFFQFVGESLPTRVARVLVLTVFVVYALRSGRRRARERHDLSRDRARLAVLVDNIPLATLAVGPDARILIWNRAAEELFGWARAEILGTENPTVPVVEKTSSNDLFRRIQAGERLHGVEAVRQARDGTTIDVALYSAPLGADGSLVLYDDVRERKRAERDRDQAQSRYRELIESLPLVTYIDNVDDHATNVYTSPQITDILGWTAEEWQTEPRHFEQIVHPDDRERVMTQVRASNATREPFDSQYRLRHRDGHYVWVRDRSAVLEDEHGQEFARGFLLDITQQKHLEEQLLQSQKMDAIGQFVGGIAHDFNNLLTGIGGYADLATATPDQAAVVTRCLAGIRAAANDAASLTSRLMAFSRHNVPERRQIDLNGIAREVASLLEPLVPAAVRVALDLDPALPPVAAEAAQLKQAVLNLGLNARDAMPDGGHLTIATHAADGNVVLRVRDTGSGMDAETRRRAPEPFFTTKPEGKGTGLGLSVVYGVIDGLGGALSIESSPGAGTTVEIRLAAADTAAPQPREDPIEGPTRRSAESVLIAEDRDVVRELARDVLVAAGFDVVAVASGHEALAAAEHEPFDLLLTDVVMPEMSGPELALKLRTTTPGLPVLYMSGYTDDVLGAHELAQDSTAFLRKPFGTNELVGAVRLLLDTQPWEPAGPGTADDSLPRVVS